MLDLPEKLPLLYYWEIEDILNVYESDEDESSKSSSELKKDISNAVKERKLTKYKSTYLQKDEFLGWFYGKYGYTFSTLLNDPPISFLTSDEPDYTLFSKAVYSNGKFTIRDAFCYLAKIPITRDEEQWSQEQIEDYHRFTTFVGEDENLYPQDIISIAERAGLPLPEEMQIPIEEIKKFNPGKDIGMQSLIDELSIECPKLSHEQLCSKASKLDDPRNKGKTAKRIARLTRSPKNINK